MTDSGMIPGASGHSFSVTDQVEVVNLKPLHVKVAEALGWSHIGPGNSMNMGDPGIGYPPSAPIVGHKVEIPRFDTDWSATGPLIDKYGFGVSKFSHRREAETWQADYYSDLTETELSMRGRTALEAVCQLILALKDAGRL